MFYFQICITVFPKQFKFSLIFEHLLMYLKKDDVLGESLSVANAGINIEFKTNKGFSSAVHRSRRAGAGAGVLTYFAGAGAGVCSPPVKL